MKVAVFGAGYVGLVTGACFAELGHDVVVRDVVEAKVDALRAGVVPIHEPGLEELLERNRERLTFTTDVAEAVEGADVVYIAVGTPPTYSGDADLSAVWTVIERSSRTDSTLPARMYWIDSAEKHKAVRLVYRMGSNEYWGVQMTDWDDAPVLADRSLTRRIGGRIYDLYYNGPKLHMVVLNTPKADYWVVNTLLDRLSNETMLAIAKGLKPLGSVKRT